MGTFASPEETTMDKPPNDNTNDHNDTTTPNDNAVGHSDATIPPNDNNLDDSDATSPIYDNAVGHSDAISPANDDAVDHSDTTTPPNDNAVHQSNAATTPNDNAVDATIPLNDNAVDLNNATNADVTLPESSIVLGNDDVLPNNVINIAPPIENNATEIDLNYSTVSEAEFVDSVDGSGSGDDMSNDYLPFDFSGSESEDAYEHMFGKQYGFHVPENSYYSGNDYEKSEYNQSDVSGDYADNHDIDDYYYDDYNYEYMYYNYYNYMNYNYYYDYMNYNYGNYDEYFYYTDSGNNYKEIWYTRKSVMKYGYSMEWCYPAYSCRNLCGTADYRYCNCDDMCLAFGDCCVDYEEHCLQASHLNTAVDSEMNLTASRLLSTISTLSIDMIEYSTCTKVDWVNKVRRVESTYSYIIDKCPSQYSHNVSKSDIDMCHADIVTELTQKVLVSDNNFIFKNIFCARCHGVKTANVTVCKLDIDCPDMDDAQEILQVEGEIGFIQYINMKCTQFFTHPYDSYYLPRRLWCSNAISECNENRLNHANDILPLLCERIQAPLKTGDSAGVNSYKNVFCAVCNEESRPLSCYDHSHYDDGYNPDLVTPRFSLLMDFSGQLQVQTESRVLLVSCPGGQILDVLSNTCLDLVCQNGEPMSSKTFCPQTSTNLKQPLMGKKKMTSLIIRVYKRDTLNDPDLGHIDVLLSDLVFKNALMANGGHLEENCMPSQNGTGPISRTENSTHLACLRAHFNSSSNDKIPSFVHYINKTIDHEEFKHFSFHFSVYNYDTRDIIKCEEGELEEMDNGRIIKRSDDIIVYHGNSSDYNDINDVPVVINWNGKEDARVKSSVCKVPTCEMVKLTNIEYNKTYEGIEISLHGNELVIGSNNLIFSNDSLLVCKHILSSVQNQTDSNEENLSSSFESVLTLCGSVVTMIALAATVVTYRTFPTLRTIPGLCVMSLSCTLFLTHLIFVTSGYFIPWSKVCSVIGIILHYLWLSVFSWMFVIISDLSSTFVKMSSTSAVSVNMEQFIIYCLISWGLPLLIVIPCVIFSIKEYLQFQYGDNTSCFISGYWPLLSGFILPLSVSIIVNMILFIRGAIYLRATMKIAKRARAASSKYEQLFLMMKVFSITGGTWILGILANIKHLKFMWYLFTFFNTLQGVYIFITFAFTVHVRQMWKAKLHQSISTSNATAKTKI